VQAATNGIEFAKSPEFCRQPRTPDCATPTCNSTASQCRQSTPQGGNLFDVKLRAIENLHANGSISSRSSHHHGINNEQWEGSSSLRSTIEEDSVPVLPAGLFTGRDEAVTASAARSAAVHAVAPGARWKSQMGLGEPARDWFPISFISTFSDWTDLVYGPQATGAVSCGCSPNCGPAWP